ncbi:MAG: hypothetical protein QHD01_05470 [Bradyrhizobium sp.]|uniref:hypothetical protein n=1 Tax=Bradyrhizobium sp. TaxID=376 RepID=UPI0029AEE2CD|nr:hypothetical protein [Bradyrhizobium sp.]MDX3966033.1 hypothetical protein [Bradyrhizobium sp.]
MNHSNPIFAGLVEGLKPGSTRSMQAGATLTIDTKMLAAEERIRIVRAVERQVELADESLTVQRRAASAAERQADALETLVALFASCIGQGRSSCAPDAVPGSWAITDVNYLRAGDGTKSFGCDRSSEPDDD